MSSSSIRYFTQSIRALLTQDIETKRKLAVEQTFDCEEENASSLDSALISEIQIESMVYDWLIRLCCLRFMDVNQINTTLIVSSVKGQQCPEILQVNLLKANSSLEAQEQLYKKLLLNTFNTWHHRGLSVFKPMDLVTQSLAPQLLGENGILNAIQRELTPQLCEEVELIGWIHQAILDEQRETMFASRAKIEPKDLPTATQIFTPKWIAQYIVENTIGRLWMINRPASSLSQKMPYYIESEEDEKNVLKISAPTEITVCDPACGSGHLLTRAFDLLYKIYKEEGWNEKDIPNAILKHNIYGIEVDERVAALTQFSLVMKALHKNPFFALNDSNLNIYVLKDIRFSKADRAKLIKNTPSSIDLQESFRLFEHATTFGSLITPSTVQYDTSNHWTRNSLISDWDDALKNKISVYRHQLELLNKKHHVVVANPPYMGGRGMTLRLSKWLKEHYPKGKSDLFAAFVIRCINLSLAQSHIGMMTPFVWMFISSYESLRELLIDTTTITSLIQLEYSGFEGATVPICTFTLTNGPNPSFKGGYIRLCDFKGANLQSPKALEAIKNPSCGWFFRCSAKQLKIMPKSPIAYWVSAKIRAAFQHKSIGEIHPGSFGMSTGDLSLIHRWYEVSYNRIRFEASCPSTFKDPTPFAPYDKGGSFRRWEGNRSFVINWNNDGIKIRNNPRSSVRNAHYFCKPHISWTLVTSGVFSCRWFSTGYLLDTASNAIYTGTQTDLKLLLALLNSTFAKELSSILNPTLNYSCGVINRVPFPPILRNKKRMLNIVDKAISICREDWDSYETSWNFKRSPLISKEQSDVVLKTSYIAVRNSWRKTVQTLQQLEEENNRYLIKAYDLEEDLSPKVPLSEISLRCNPHHRYSRSKSGEDLEARLLSDTLKEFISYAVGCMMGRYSLDKLGLIIASQNLSPRHYFKMVSSSQFTPCEDGIICCTSKNWLDNELSDRFKLFLKQTFGSIHFEENLSFIEHSIHPKKNRRTSIENYCLKSFYKDHCRMYKKRPIYWMFSSKKGHFKAFIYLHRYTPNTPKLIMDNHLTPLKIKLLDTATNLKKRMTQVQNKKTELKRSLKELNSLNDVLEDLKDFEERILNPLIISPPQIDLDDGVVVNGEHFGAAFSIG